MSEFARPIRLDALGDAPQRVAIEADAGERESLARRFELVALDRLTAEAELVRDGDEVRATGVIDADAVQACVATGAAVSAHLSAPFDLRFVPVGSAETADVELAAAELDLVPYEGGAIDLGEAAAQTLALALDPWPRAPDADTALRAAGVLLEGEEAHGNAFAKLKGLLGH